MKQLRPYAKELGCWDALSRHRVDPPRHRRGPAVVRAGAPEDLHEMLSELADVTELAAGPLTLRSPARP